MKKTVLIGILCLPLLTGCSVLDFFQKPDSGRQVQVDPKLLQPCQPLDNLVNTSDEGVAEHHIRTIAAYGVCAKQQDSSIKAIRTLANLPKED